MHGCCASGTPLTLRPGVWYTVDLSNNGTIPQLLQPPLAVVTCSNWVIVFCTTSTVSHIIIENGAYSQFYLSMNPESVS